ncbi:MAG: carbonic anhydrase [Planctomycetota bacterium]|nr:carbonic anhydrase [Planctomycetota bacterium]
MQKLIDGIRQFQTDGYSKNQELFEGLAQGQSPLALFITCADSRIDPNLLTGTKPGELFVLRTAGNIVPCYGSMLGGEAATIEYAVLALKIRDIIICGHSHCGAMGGLLNPDATQNLPAVTTYLEHAQSTCQKIDENYPDLTDPDVRLTRAVEENVLVQLENLRTHPSVATAVGNGDLNLHGWVYKFETGEVYEYASDQNAFQLVQGDTPTADD